MDLRTLHPEELAPWHRALSGDFPAGECKPLEDIRALIAQGRYEILGRFQREALCGYAALWRHEDFPSYVMLDYLGGGGAARRRNQGLGSEILAWLTARLPAKTVLITEAEAPEGTADNALCLRRIAFYQRCGFAPVYRTAACGGVFQALAWGVVTDIAALQRAHRAIYGPARTDVQIPLDPKQPPKRPYWME